MTIFKPRCPALHPDLPYSRCTSEEGHLGEHANTAGNLWDEREHIGPKGEIDWYGLYLSENRRAEKALQERDMLLDDLRKAEARAETAEHYRDRWQANALAHNEDWAMVRRALNAHSDDTADDIATKIRAVRDRAEEAELDRDHWRRVAHVCADRIEQTELDLNEARKTIEDMRAEIEACDVHNGVVIEPTDEMVERARTSLRRDGWTVDDLPGDGQEELRRALTAALTEPPQRPHGAKALEEVCAGINLAGIPLDAASLADYLAKRGVRVTEDGEDR